MRDSISIWKDLTQSGKRLRYGLTTIGLTPFLWSLHALRAHNIYQWKHLR